MNLHQIIWMRVLAGIYTAMLIVLVIVGFQNDLMSVLVVGVVVIVAGNLIAALLIYGVLYDILQKLREEAKVINLFHGESND